MKCVACAEEITEGLTQCPNCKTVIAPTSEDAAHASMPGGGQFLIVGSLLLGFLSLLGMSQVNGGAVLVGLACLSAILARIIQAGAQHKAEINRRSR